MVYAHLLATARERGWNLVNPTFEPYADFFVGTCPRPHGRSLLAVRCAWQAGKVLAPLSRGRIARARARNTRMVDLESVVLAAEAGRARWLLLQGFRIRCPQWVARQAPGLRAFFTPIDVHRQPAEALIAAQRQRAEVVVGVHIRQGDYAQHVGGRYFYTMSEYADLMRRMQQIMAPRTVAFVICTHVPLPSSVFAEFTWKPGPGHMVADLHALSECDYILGPPSSFSAWAAFYGAKRLLRVTSAEQRFMLADFTEELFPETHD